MLFSAKFKSNTPKNVSRNGLFFAVSIFLGCGLIFESCASKVASCSVANVIMLLIARIFIFICEADLQILVKIELAISLLFEYASQTL